VAFCLILFSHYSPAKEECLFSKPCFKTNENAFFKQEKLTLLEIPQSVIIDKNSFKESVPVNLVKSEVLATLAEDISEREEIIEYIVQEGDTLAQIAAKFNISLETILWANDLTSQSKLKVGQKLTILPVSGVMHLVKKGETLSEIALLYKADISKTRAFNNLSEGDEIFAGDILIIPDGKKPPKISITQTQYTPIASSYFILPVPSSFKISQGLHWFNAIDFSNGRCGDLVFAAAGGEIQQTGYDKTAGRYVRIVHPNGVITFYGHLSATLKAPGQAVSQGDIIGYVGSTGVSTGCHLHFDVRGARNSFAR